MTSSSNPEGLVPERVIDTSNRRSAGVVYLVAALFAGLLIVATSVDALWLTAVAPLVVLGAYNLAAGRHLRVTDHEAIAIATEATAFDVGHGSATLGFVGIMARPIWEVLVFESGSVPGHQALVTVDGLSGDVTGTYGEAVDPV